ncbi:MAG: choice-of-anchor Q domain-containing protein, partial [Planctomycetota bacterium]
VQGGWTGTGNIDADPMFADDDGRLLPGSPCVDAGDNDAIPVDIVTDLDGNRRVVDGDHSGSEDIDIGAYEVQWPIDNATQGT